MTRLALLLSLALAHSGAAEGPAGMLWTEAGVQVLQLIDLVQAWRPSGWRPPPAWRTDLEDLGRRLEKLRERVGWSKDAPPDIGIFFDERLPTVVRQIRIGGPAELAGIRLGDQFLKVSGHEVASYAEIARWTKEGPGPFEVELQGRGLVSLGKRKPDYPPSSLIRKLEEELSSLQEYLEEIKAAGGDADELAQRIKELEDRMRDIQEESARRYRSS